MKILFLTFLFLFLSLGTWAKEKAPLVLGNQSYEYEVFDRFEAWSERELQNEGFAITPEFFMKNPSPAKSTGEITYKDQIIWVKIPVTTTQDFEAGNWVFSMTPKDTLFTVFLFNDKKDLLSKNENKTNSKTAEVIIPLDKNQKYYIVARTVRSYFLSFKLSKNAFREGQLSNDFFISGLFFGAIGVLFIYNCMIFFALKEWIYLFYLGYLASVMSVLAILMGIASLNHYLTAISLVTCLGFCVFSSSQLRLLVHFPWLRLPLNLFCALIILFMVGAICPTGIWFMPIVEMGGDFILGFVALCMLVFALILAKRKEKGAYIYILGWAPLFFSVIFYLSRVYFFEGNTDKLEFTIMKIGTLLQTIIFTVAFTYRVRDLETENALHREKVKDTEKLKNLVRIICHDIANPLTLILGHAQFQRQKTLDPIWETVCNASERINRLISRVRTLQALTEKKKEMLFEEFPLERILFSPQEVFELKLKEKEIRLIVDISPAVLMDKVCVDRDLFENSILNNVISNAIKFSYPKSCIYLRAKSDKEKVVIEVEDQGLGIPQSLLEDIFSIDKSFSRLGTQGEKGTGFGMPLVKTLLQEMGGDITLKSSSFLDGGTKSGTTVFITLRKNLSE